MGRFDDFIRRTTPHLRPHRARLFGLPVWVVTASEDANPHTAEHFEPVIVLFGNDARARHVAQQRFARTARARQALEHGKPEPLDPLDRREYRRLRNLGVFG